MSVADLILPLDDAVGTATAADASGHGRGGVVHGGVTFGVAGKRINGASLNGSTGYLRVTDWGTLTGSFTLAAWINLASVGTQQGIITKTKQNDGGFEFRVATSGALELVRRVGGTGGPGSSQSDTTAALLSTNTWYHCATSFDSSAAVSTVYINGVAARTVTSAVVGTNADDFLVGAVNPSTPTAFFGGVLQDVRVYPAALLAAEILSIVNGVAPRRSNLIPQIAQTRGVQI